MTERLQLAIEVARSIGLPESWMNLRTIEAALVCESKFGRCSLEDAAGVLVSCAEYFCRAGVAKECSHLLRYFPINRFWFEDAVWRETGTYLLWQENRSSVSHDEACPRHPDSGLTTTGGCWGCYSERCSSQRAPEAPCQT